jgi:hypothetical protein
MKLTTSGRGKLTTDFAGEEFLYHIAGAKSYIQVAQNLNFGNLP